MVPYKSESKNWPGPGLEEKGRSRATSCNPCGSEGSEECRRGLEAKARQRRGTFDRRLGPPAGV
jgi:hypothetical protein